MSIKLIRDLQHGESLKVQVIRATKEDFDQQPIGAFFENFEDETLFVKLGDGTWGDITYYSPEAWGGVVEAYDGMWRSEFMVGELGAFYPPLPKAVVLPTEPGVYRPKTAISDWGAALFRLNRYGKWESLDLTLAPDETVEEFLQRRGWVMIPMRSEIGSGQ